MSALPESQPCPHCHGTGRWPLLGRLTMPCLACAGTGVKDGRKERP